MAFISSLFSKKTAAQQEEASAPFAKAPMVDAAAIATSSSTLSLESLDETRVSKITQENVILSCVSQFIADGVDNRDKVYFIHNDYGTGIQEIPDLTKEAIGQHIVVISNDEKQRENVFAFSQERLVDHGYFSSIHEDKVVIYWIALDVSKEEFSVFTANTLNKISKDGCESKYISLEPDATSVDAMDPFEELIKLGLINKEWRKFLGNPS